MVAPNSAYWSKALKDKTTPHNYLMCKFLSEYTSIGTHFYLDKIAKYKHDSIFYFGGACFVGSKNSKYHARKRVGKLFDGIELYTDGGLNTLGDIDNVIIKSALKEGGIKLTATYKASYYNVGVDHGIYFKLLPSGDLIKRSFYEQNIEPKQVVTKDNFVVNNLDADNLLAGNLLQIIPYIKNEEGEFSAPAQIITINPYVIWMKYAELSEFNSLATAANALRTRTMPSDDSIGIVGFSTYYRNSSLAPEGRIRVYKPAKTPSEIAQLGRDYEMEDMTDSSNGMLGYFQDVQKTDSNGDITAESYEVNIYNGLPYIINYMDFKFLIPIYKAYQGQFQSINQFSETYSPTATYIYDDIKNDVSEWMKAGFNPSEWDNPNYTNYLTANTNDYQKRYLENGYIKYLWYITYASVIATGFIVFPVNGYVLNYAWEFYQDGKLIFEGMLPFPATWQ